MRKVCRRFRALVRDQRGMETVEWAILAALLVAGVAAVVVGLGQNVLAKFTDLRNQTQ